MTGSGEFGAEATISRLEQALVDAEQHNRQLTERLRFYRDAVAEAAQLTGVSRWANEDLVSWLRRGMRAAGEVMPADVRARIRLIESGPAAKSIRGRRAGAGHPCYRPRYLSLPVLVDCYGDGHYLCRDCARFDASGIHGQRD